MKRVLNRLNRINRNILYRYTITKDSIGIIILAKTKLIGIETMFLAGVNGLMVLIFLTGSSMGWLAPSHAQFFNSIMASTKAGSSLPYPILQLNCGFNDSKQLPRVPSSLSINTRGSSSI